MTATGRSAGPAEGLDGREGCSWDHGSRARRRERSGGQAVPRGGWRVSDSAVYRAILCPMPHFRIREAAELLGVSDDTVRRWIDAGGLKVSLDDSGRKVVEGAQLARFAVDQARATPDPSSVTRSARNRFVGIVTEVISDTVMSQVEMLCGGQRVVSLMSTEAVRELELVPGSLAVAVIKATTVIVETPGGTA